jgi:hypothetical protein
VLGINILSANAVATNKLIETLFFVANSWTRSYNPSESSRLIVRIVFLTGSSRFIVCIVCLTEGFVTSNPIKTVSWEKSGKLTRGKQPQYGELVDLYQTT